jgi:endoglucanase
VCDDLAGAAAAMTMLDALVKKPPRTTVALLLTRAEEVGFIGAIAAATRSSLLRNSDRIISIECSSAQPFAPQGAGVILRVGDRTSIFNSDFTYFLNEQAQVLAKRDKSFKFQRALMPGGSCEGTVFDAYGFVTGAICVPLGNYHNMDRAKRAIAPEHIELGDWQSMVKLFEHVARNAHAFKPGFGSLRKRLETRFKKYERLL